ncbi:MAG: hypothetical protein ABI583_09545, partial [Betaproteobacteria bacterium]
SGLNYTISATRAALGGGAGSAATAGSIGSADTWTYAIAGNMPASQAGTCIGGVCSGTQVRTLTVTY